VAIIGKWVHLDLENGPEVRRLAVPGGWLYQVEEGVDKWYPPVFVPSSRD